MEGFTSMFIPRFQSLQSSKAYNFFVDNGFCVFSDVITETNLLDFRQELAEIIKSHMIRAGIDQQYDTECLFHHGMAALERADHSFVASVYDTIFQCMPFLRIVSDSALSNLVQDFLGNPSAPLYGYTNRCRIDPPLDERRTYGWHQEVFYTVPRGHYIQSWAPLLEDATVHNGTIQVCVGSHKENIAKQNWLEIQGRATQILVDDSIVQKYPQIDLELKLGELVLFSGYLIHRSGSNVSNKHRYSLVGMYHDASVKEFQPPMLSFEYRGESPYEYYQDSKSNGFKFTSNS